MRERLIELLNECQHEYDKEVVSAIAEQRPFKGENYFYADHLLANGVIVPPCKVGETVYVLSQGAGFSVVWNVYKSIVKAIHLDSRGQLFCRVETDKENIGGYVEVERVFLTREEAEKALEERSKENG